MKHIFLNLKRFDIPTEKAGVNAIAPVTEWGSYIIHHIQEPLEKYRGKDLLIDRCGICNLFPGGAYIDGQCGAEAGQHG